MTTQKDLKKLVRSRQLQTGESYTTARLAVLHSRPTPRARERNAPNTLIGLLASSSPRSFRIRELGTNHHISLRTSGPEFLKFVPGQLDSLHCNTPRGI